METIILIIFKIMVAYLMVATVILVNLLFNHNFTVSVENTETGEMYEPSVFGKLAISLSWIYILFKIVSKKKE